MTIEDFILQCPDAVTLFDEKILSKEKFALEFSDNKNYLFMKSAVTEYMKYKGVKVEIHGSVNDKIYNLKVGFK